jgi:hypothetical protein
MPYLIRNPVFFQGAHDQFGVIDIVFNKHDEDWFANHSFSLQCCDVPEF